MKKKGFTLVELLAVIVVIGIIAIITVPIVLNNVTSTEKKTFKVSVNEVKRNVDRYLVKNDLKRLPACGDNNVVLKNIDFLKNRNVFTDDSYMCYDDETACDYIYARSNLKKSGSVILAYGCFDDVKIIDGQKNSSQDQTGPEYTGLSFNNTSSSITVNINWYDKESGIDEGTIKYAIKKHDGGSWSEWQTSNKFNKLIENTDYDVRIKVLNKAGIYGYAMGTTKTLELDEPIYEQNINGYTSENKIVTIIYPEAPEGETYTYSYSLNGGYTWIETSEIKTKLEFSEAGSVIARVFDGTNYKVASTLTISGIDKSKPSCSLQVVSGSLGTNKEWYISSSVNVKLTTSTAKESGILYSSPTESTTASYSSEVSFGQAGVSSTSITTNGIKKLHGYVKTKAGKTGECSLTIKKDTNPTGVSVGLTKAYGGSYKPGEYSGEDVVLTAYPTESSAPSGYSYAWSKAGSSTVLSTNKTYTATSSGIYKVRVTSGAGLSKDSANFSVNIDKCTIPTVAITAPVASGVYVNQSSVLLTANPTCTGTGGGTSGYTYQWYKNGVKISNATSKTYKATSSGSYTVKVTVNSTGEESVASNTHVVLIDTDNPQISVTAKKASSGTSVASNIWSNEKLNVTISGTDMSGVKKLYYCMGKSCDPTATNISAAYKGNLVSNASEYTLVIENTKETYIRFQAEDGFGKKSEVGQYIAKVDATTPTISWNIKNSSDVSSSELSSLSIDVPSTSERLYFKSYVNLNDFSPDTQVAKNGSTNVSGSTIKCTTGKLGTIENMTFNSLYLGNYNISCTVTSGAGRSATASKYVSVASLFYPYGNSKNKMLAPSGASAALYTVGGVAYATSEVIRLPGYQYGPYARTISGCYMIAYIGDLSISNSDVVSTYEAGYDFYNKYRFALSSGKTIYFTNVTRDSLNPGLESIMRITDDVPGFSSMYASIEKLLIAPISSTYCS